MSAINETARERLEDVRELAPTSNGELRDRWDMDSTREVARYLREELGEYTYRDENSKIRARTDEIEPTGISDQDEPTEPANVAPADEGNNLHADEETDTKPVKTRGKGEKEGTNGRAEESLSDGGGAAVTASTAASDAPTSSDPQTSTLKIKPVDDAPAKEGAVCPDCGDDLANAPEGRPFLATDGKVAVPEASDRICKSCDVVVEDDGEVIYGNESAAATSTPNCRKCGDETVDNRHALYLLARWFKQTGRMKYADRRRVKKLEQNIKQADYVCVNCWAIYR